VENLQTEVQSTRETVLKQTKMIARLLRVVEMQAYKDAARPEPGYKKLGSAGAADGTKDSDEDANADDDADKDDDHRNAEKQPRKRGAEPVEAELLEQIHSSKHRHRSKRRRL
jgi:hypothetical protein